MGKSLKGKNLGKGISQRQDGRYYVRFTDKYGINHSKYFKNLPEAKQWLHDTKKAIDEGIPYKMDNSSVLIPELMTVNDWHKYWLENIVNNLAPNTRRNYLERYNNNIKPVIGKMLLQEIKPLHCRMVLNIMETEPIKGTDKYYAGSTVRQCYITMGTMFKSALMNGFIEKHPMDGVRYTKPKKAPKDIVFLTVEEQGKFLKVAQRSHNRHQYELILETGLRTSELIGLIWDDIDFKNKTLSVRRTLEYRHSSQVWRAGPTKTQASYRTIPLTDRAFEILKNLYDGRFLRKESPDLMQKLPYLDRFTGEEKELYMQELVFVNYRTGMPNKNSSYDTHLYKLCDEAKIKRFCMHALRHTYATRAIERGMNPKMLQKLLGHSSFKTTMDKYVHTSDEELRKAVKLFEQKVS